MDEHSFENELSKLSEKYSNSLKVLRNQGDLKAKFSVDFPYSDVTIGLYFYSRF